MSQKSTQHVHNSFFSYYVRSSYKGSTFILNLSKIYNKYINTLLFIYNLFFYKFKTVLFGNIFFKNEIYTINWITCKKMYLFLRLSQLMFLVKPLKRCEGSNKIIKLWHTKGVSTAIIFDCIYHKTTVDFLHKLSVMTVGPLPLTCNIKDLDLVIPISNDNLFSYLFILKTISHLNKVSEYNRYIFFRKIWFSFSKIS